MRYTRDSPRAISVLREVTRCAGPRVGHCQHALEHVRTTLTSYLGLICIPQSAGAAVGRLTNVPCALKNNGPTHDWVRFGVDPDQLVTFSFFYFEP